MYLRNALSLKRQQTQGSHPEQLYLSRVFPFWSLLSSICPRFYIYLYYPFSYLSSLAVSEGFQSWPFHLILCDLQKRTCHLWSSVSFYRNDTSSWEIIIFMWEMHEIPSACHALNVIFIIMWFSMYIAFITFYPFMMPLVMYLYLWQLLVIITLKIKQFKI